MGRFANKVFREVDKLMETLSAVILGGMTILIFSQVLARYLFKAPLAWSEEGARFLFIWMTFIAGYVGARKVQHIGVELIQNVCPPILRNAMKIISDLLSIAFFLIVFYFCCTQWSKLSAQISPALKLPMSIVYLGMMIGCLGLAISYLLHLFEILKEKGGDNKT